MSKEVIEVRNLTKYYGKHLGVDNISFTVGSGEVFGFIGPNGAGKSTTIRTLLGLIYPTDGNVRIMGMNPAKYRKKVLSNVGYMPSEAMFYNDMRVEDVILYSQSLHGKDCSRTATKLCSILELDQEKRIRELSLGNRKKVSIVCAMQHNPMVYIFDEPTSGLDPLMQKTFFELIGDRNKEGATIFLSSHVLSEIQRYCHSAAIIRDGKIIASDTVSNLSESAARRVRIVGTGNLSGLEGIRDVHKFKGGVDFLYTGDQQLLIKKLGDMKISDITITEPDLEEIFMHYYERRA